MDNLIEAISILKADKTIKDSFLDEFDLQINTLNFAEKEKVYKILIENKDMLDLFFEKFDASFIQESILKSIKQSNIKDEDISKKIYINLDVLTLRKILGELFNKNISKEIADAFGDFLQDNFYNAIYDKLSLARLGLKNNIEILNIIFYIILSSIKEKGNDNSINIQLTFSKLFQTNYLYQYIPFNQVDNDSFGEHLLRISFLVLFIEENNRSFQLKREDNITDNYQLTQIFEMSVDLNEEKFEKPLLNIKQFGLIYNLLVQLENKERVNNRYIEKTLNTLLNFHIISTNELVNFCILFCRYDDVKNKYIQYINGIKIDNKKIFKNLETPELVNDTILFLLLDVNKSLLDELLTNKLIEQLKNKLIEGNELNNIFSKLYEKFMNGELSIKKLNLTLNEFGNQLINSIISNRTDEKQLYRLANIEKLLLADDRKDFDKKLLSDLIDRINEIGIEEFRNIFRWIKFVQEDVLATISGKIKTDYLRDLEKLNIYLEILKFYNKPFHYDGLKENIESRLSEEQDENILNILNEIKKKLK